MLYMWIIGTSEARLSFEARCNEAAWHSYCKKLSQGRVCPEAAVKVVLTASETTV